MGKNIFGRFFFLFWESSIFPWMREIYGFVSRRNTSLAAWIFQQEELDAWPMLGTWDRRIPSQPCE